ncbi:serine/threonine-protein kinase-like protein CR4 isoform X2 [Telopea speciosissima]|nr:serine/threonine-protein kinase-like protein CR4 isoform X2 [Telopea speciosissima]
MQKLSDFVYMVEWIYASGISRCLVRDFLTWVFKMNPWKTGFLLQAIMLVAVSNSWWMVSGLGSMSSIAVSYGENGPVFCGLRSDGSHLVTCYGSDSAIIYGTPARFAFSGLTAGDAFVCGLLLESSQPYCWGSSIYIQMGVPQPMLEGAEYLEISAGDHHFCGLRKPKKGRLGRYISLVDCWGYNMTANHVFGGKIMSITAGSMFNCGLFSDNRTVFCWGDESSSGVISSMPLETKFQSISAGGYHVCGILEGHNSRAFCWGRSLELDMETEISTAYSDEGNVALVPEDPMVSVVGGKFHACGIKSSDHGVICWGRLHIGKSTPAPNGVKVYEIAAGDYFTCGVLADKSLQPVCWGLGFPTSLPLAVSPGLCMSYPCSLGYYEFSHGTETCKSPNSRVCLPCSSGCPSEMYQTIQCMPKSDRHCEFNCSSCVSADCLSNCSFPVMARQRNNGRIWSLQMPIFVAELVFAVFFVIAVSLSAFFYVRYKLQRCHCSLGEPKAIKSNVGCASFHKENGKVRPDLDELKIRRAQMFNYEELEKATGGFKEESIVGRGSFSCVFKGVLSDETVVAVKRAIKSTDLKKNSKEFHTELDLLSRLNHAHLLNLLGYCEEGGERLLVYEFMAHGSLHQHLHGKNPRLKEQLDWVRRVTIAVQAARGIEYLHGYACPPVIHRDIKSSNILIDEEHNARVADFGLSLLGPTDSSSPLAELPAGTLGYLDPEYYRLHYLTTKSDVYSFGVLLLEILSGRKAIDMQFEEGNIVEWAVPLIKAGDLSAILDPVLKPPADLEALKRIANVACKCVRMRGKERPSMDKVTTALERALALLMGSPCNEQPILPTEVVLGSSRLHKKSSQRSSNRSGSEADVIETEDQRFEFRAPSWITFPSVTSSQRRKSSVSDADIDGKNLEARNLGNGGGACDGLRCLEEEIGPASPQRNLFLQHNF